MQPAVAAYAELLRAFGAEEEAGSWASGGRAGLPAKRAIGVGLREEAIPVPDEPVQWMDVLRELPPPRPVRR